MAETENGAFDLGQRLTDWGRAKLIDAGGFTVRAVSRPDNGRSSETYLVDVDLGPNTGGHARWVLRLEPRRRQIYEDASVERQFRILQRLEGEASVPTPDVRLYEPDAQWLGAPFFVMERLEGEAPPNNHHSEGLLFEATPAERERMWLAGIEAMAKLHRLPAAPFDFLGYPGFGASGVEQELGRWDSYRRWAAIRPLPILDRARDWLEARKPTGQGVGLAWGDARIGNILFNNGRCVALLDWETASLGGAESDLGWWLFYEALVTDMAGIPRLEGLGGRDETIAAWEGFAGRKAEAMEWHEAFGAYRFALVYERARSLATSGEPGLVGDRPTLRRLEQLIG